MFLCREQTRSPASISDRIIAGSHALQTVTRALTLFLGILATVLSAEAATKYVSGSVLVSGNGNSWLTAWKSPANINWSSIAPGDTIYLDGGLLGMSYGAFSTITASGTSNNYITIARSTELGRDGMVTIAT